MKSKRDYLDRLATLREEIAALRATIEATQNAPRPLLEIEQRIEAWLEGRAAQRRPRGGSFASPGEAPRSGIELGGLHALAPPDCQVALAALFRPRVREFLDHRREGPSSPSTRPGSPRPNGASGSSAKPSRPDSSSAGEATPTRGRRCSSSR
jgi:hypothetical protein